MNQLPANLAAAAEAWTDAQDYIRTSDDHAISFRSMQWLFAELLKSAPPFDEDACTNAWVASHFEYSDAWDAGARFQHSQMAGQVAALRAMQDQTREWREEAVRVRDKAEADLARLREERDRYKAALEVLHKHAHGFCDPHPMGQCELCYIAETALNLQPAQQEVRMSPQEKADVLEWALRRAMDWLQASGGSSHAAKCEVLKILADNGLTYDADGKLVERKAEG